MNIDEGRIGRFIQAARRLLLLQVLAAAIAIALGIWAVVEVRDLAAERDRLRTALAAMQSRAPGPDAAALPAPTTPTAESLVRPPAILPMAIPIGGSPVDADLMLPVPPPAGDLPADAPVAEPEEPVAAAEQSRARPGRWTRPTAPAPRERPVGNEQQAPAPE